jgi:cytochrome c oxidase cbb3-type subunit 2
MDALIAYMRKLGTDIPVKKAQAVAETPVALNNPFTDLKAVEDEAEAIYKQQCASCHGEKREGTLGPALKGSARTDAELFTIISKGVEANGMPSFGTSLGEQKIWKLVTYIKLDK